MSDIKPQPKVQRAKTLEEDKNKKKKSAKSKLTECILYLTNTYRKRN